MIIDIGPNLYSGPSSPYTNDVSFKVALFLSRLINLNYSNNIWYDDRYWSKIFQDHPDPSLMMAFRSRQMLLNLMVSMLVNRLINFSYIRHDDRYRSQILFGTIHKQ